MKLDPLDMQESSEVKKVISRCVAYKRLRGRVGERLWQTYHMTD